MTCDLQHCDVCATLRPAEQLQQIDRGEFTVRCCVGQPACEQDAGRLQFARTGAPAEQLRLLAMTGYALFESSLGSSNRRLFDRMHAPQRGDLVLETTSLFRWESDPDRALTALGYLHAVTQEPIMSEAEWYDRSRYVAEGEPVTDDTWNAAYEWRGDHDAPYAQCPTEKVFWIAPLDPRQPLCRWTNSSFVALPDRLGWTEPPRR